MLVVAPEGIKALEAAHPDIELYCASIDSHLNEQGYIIPGLGDAGDKFLGQNIPRNKTAFKPSFFRRVKPKKN